MSFVSPKVPSGILAITASLTACGKFVGHVGGDESGGHGVAGDGAAGEFAGDGLGETDQAGLAGGVVRLAGVADQADDRGDVDDARVLGFHQHAHEAFHGVEGTLEIGVEHGVPVLFLHAHEQAVAGDAGVVDEDVHGAHFIGDFFGEFLHGGVVGHVHGIGGGGSGKLGVDFLRGFAAARSTAADHRDLGSLRGERAGDFLTDSAASSGDDGDFIGKA